jgi:hypothetical protein
LLPFISLGYKFTLSRLTFYLIVDCCTIPQEFRRILTAFENRKIADLSLVILIENVEKLSLNYRITELVKTLLSIMYYRCPNPDPSPAVCGSFLIGFACWGRENSLNRGLRPLFKHQLPDQARMRADNL